MNSGRALWRYLGEHHRLALTVPAMVAGALCPPTQAAQPQAASAEPTPPELALPADNPWLIRVNPRVWYVGPAGDVRLPAGRGSGFADSGDSVDLSDLNLDSQRLSPYGELTLQAERFRFTFAGFGLQLEQQGFESQAGFRVGGLTVQPGDVLDVEFEYAGFDLTVGYLLYQHEFRGENAGASEEPGATLRLHGLAGARLSDLDLDLRSVGGGAGEAGVDELFIEPIVGVRAELELARDFQIDLQLSGGGFADSDRSSFSFDVAVGFTWNPVGPLSVQIGWRQLLVSLEDGDGPDMFEYDGTLAGLFLGATIEY